MSPLPLLLALPLAAPAHALPKAVEQYGTVEARRLTVHLDLDPAELAYTGTSSITFEHSRPIEEVVIHAAEGMELTEVRFRRGQRTWAATATELGEEQWAIRPESAVPLDGFQLPRPKKAARGEPLFATPSFAWLDVEFTNEVNETAYGLYRFEHDGEPYLVTQFEADDAREAFPCIDLPDAKVSLWMSLTVPEDLVALSNGPVQSEEVHEDGTKTVSFGATRPIPTYAMALAVGPYEAQPIPDLSVPGQLWTVAGHTELGGPLAAEIAPLLAWEEEWFGSEYPYKKLDWLAVPEFAFGGMENPGLVILTERLLMPADQRTPDAIRWQQEVVGHELAHMWFGDLVTLEWWDDFWLNESFAEWLGNRAATEVSGDVGFEFRRVGSTQGAVQSDGRGTMRSVRTDIDPTRIFETTNFLAYPKGEALLTMVEAWIGEAVFREGVRRYMEAHADGNASSADLFAALSDASGKDVGKVLGPWLDRPGAPLIALEPGDGGEVRYSQRRYLAAGAEAEDRDAFWATPMVVRWGDDGGTHTEVVLLDDPKGAFTLPVEGELQWLFPTADGIGYFVWTQPGDRLDALIAAAPEALSAPERSSLVGDLDLLTTAGILDAGELLALLEDFSEESHPKVIGDILSAQSVIRQVIDEAEEPQWAAYVRQTRRPWLEQLGDTPVDGEDPDLPALRARLLNQLLRQGEDPEVRDRLRPVAEAFLADESAYDPHLTGLGMWVLADEAEDPAAFQDQMLEKAETTENPRFRSLYLSTFAQAPGEEARDRALAMALDPETAPRDLWPLLAALPDETEADKDFELDWVIAHHETLLSKLPPQGSGWLARTGSGCDADRWDRAKAFFGAEERRSPAVDRAIAEGTEALALCQAAREAHREPVLEFLGTFVEPEEGTD